MLTQYPIQVLPRRLSSTRLCSLPTCNSSSSCSHISCGVQSFGAPPSSHPRTHSYTPPLRCTSRLATSPCLAPPDLPSLPYPAGARTPRRNQGSPSQRAAVTLFQVPWTMMTRVQLRLVQFPNRLLFDSSKSDACNLIKGICA